MQITVFGATGRTGIPLCEQALARNYEVVAHTRSPEKLPFEDEQLTIVEGDVYTGDGVAEAVEGADAVVSVLGHGDGSPDDLLTVAGDHIIEAMEDANVTRFVTLVGAGVREEGESVSLGGKIMGALLKLLARDVLEDAAEHARRVRASQLEWTILRAPRLGEGNPEGDYRIGDLKLGFDAVDRGDVATCLLDRLEKNDYGEEMPKVGAV
ncbi:NAD(P)H-binding protein [Natronorubrum sp. JWXQ-INN-674]|uniref:NAD(P)H-binding protein n=1 Tax=Natronorubrum halalkaliphilum TaxID=2691917 RepID=A0A6B0VMF8_9EURY|nr:NAD(P)H-binding protein [Natronorubrum halalkaliphilum]MXV61942.1 NAD(P)H-binding protein [Natronorubrum halalkaliphilum]